MSKGGKILVGVSMIIIVVLVAVFISLAIKTSEISESDKTVKHWGEQDWNLDSNQAGNITVPLGAYIINQVPSYDIFNCAPLKTGFGNVYAQTVNGTIILYENTYWSLCEVGYGRTEIYSIYVWSN